MFKKQCFYNRVDLHAHYKVNSLTHINRCKLLMKLDMQFWLKTVRVILRKMRKILRQQEPLCPLQTWKRPRPARSATPRPTACVWR